MTQKQQILEYLSDGEWHCMATPNFFIKDDRKIISDLNADGYVIEGKPCDGRCGIKHHGKIFMRRDLTVQKKNQSNKPLSSEEHLKLFGYIPEIKTKELTLF